MPLQAQVPAALRIGVACEILRMDEISGDGHGTVVGMTDRTQT